LTNATTVASGDESPMNLAPFSALLLANFRESPECELRQNGVLRSSIRIIAYSLPNAIHSYCRY
jgi:hypothetical protein